jgi:16S rRNA (adenine1518-N6/adenine1519-N6)-dimethyltransferase
VKRSRAHALGQHFLSHPGLLNKIVRVIDPRPDELIIEVGPGRGALTALLAQKARRVIGVEKDDRLIILLEGRNLPRTSIVHGDILKADWAALVKESGAAAGKAKLAGNIPYAISSPLLARVLETKDLFSLCVFLIQKEFAERLAAGPGSKKYAPLSMLMQRAFVVKQHFTVSRHAFVPPPRVESAVVSLTPREKPIFPVDDEPLLTAFLRAAFAHRRKTLANNLERAGLPRDTVAEALAECGLKPKVRAEEVPIGEFAGLFTRLESAVPLSRILSGGGSNPEDVVT